jgi:hypothetical protein
VGILLGRTEEFCDEEEGKQVDSHGDGQHSSQGSAREQDSVCCARRRRRTCATRGRPRRPYSDRRFSVLPAALAPSLIALRMRHARRRKQPTRHEMQNSAHYD